MSYSFDKKSGHILDADGIAIAYSHVSEWGVEIAAALNEASADREKLERKRPFVKQLVDAYKGDDFAEVNEWFDREFGEK